MIMADTLKVFELSDDELLIELKSRGLKHGPITKNTRRLFEKILTKALGCDVSDKTLENDDCNLQDLGKAKNGRDCTNVTECTNSISDRSFSSYLQSPLIFYGVCFDADCSKLASEMLTLPAVFSSKDEALKAAKKIKGARFKGFKSREEAEFFSCSSLKEKEQPASPSSLLQSPRDPGSTFKSPTPQELVKFRKVIEQAKGEEFLDVVLKNPRYLIAPGDTPVILQEGARYNALHVAAKSNTREMCQLVIETLESDRFWKVYLSENFDSMKNAKRKRFLVDMYLNTPDSGCWETPLHFACKFGHASVVEYLVSLPLTDLNRPNKDGKTPAQVICSRCLNESSKLRSQIIRLLEDNCFVPLLGAADNSTPPRIGNPWSPDVTDGSSVYEIGSKGGSLAGWQQTNSPGEPAVTVRAYAGPMSPSKAAEFYHLWKTPPSNQEKRNSFIQIKRKDNSRGVERIGRQLAHDRLIPWSEYWSFLGSYADLSSAEGLKKLEDYLAKKKHLAFLNKSVTPQRIRAANSNVLKTPESRQSIVVVNLNSTPTQTQDSVPLCLTDNMAMDTEEDNGLSAKKALFVDSEGMAMETESIGDEIGARNAFHKRPVGLNHQSVNGSILSRSSLQHITPKKALFKDSHLEVKTEIIGAEDVCDNSLLNRPGSVDLNRQIDDENLLSEPDSQRKLKTESLGVENVFRNTKQNRPGPVDLNHQSDDANLLSGRDSQRKVKAERLGDENQFGNTEQKIPGSADFNHQSSETQLVSGSSKRSLLLQDAQIRNSEERAMETVTKTLEALSLHQSKESKGDRGLLPSDNSELKDSLDRSDSIEMADRSAKEEQVEKNLSCNKKLSFSLLLGSNESPLKDTGYTKASGFDSMETPVQNKIAEARNMSSSSTTSDSFGERRMPLRGKNYLGGNLWQDETLDNRSEIQRSVSHSLVTSSVNALSSDVTMMNKKTANLPDSKEHQSLPMRSGSCSDVLGLGGRGPDDIFIQGSQPSKLDLDVLLAIGQEGIDPIKFPHIARWKKLVTSYSDTTQLSWPSPGSPRYQLRQKSSLLWSC